MKIKQKVLTQHCIKSHFFNEVIQLPSDVTLVSVDIEVGFAIKRLSQQIPDNLVSLGVSAIRKTDPSVEVNARLTGSRAHMKRAVKEICKDLDLRDNTVRVKRMVVSTHNGRNEGIFHRMSKMLPEGDKLKRHVVLGLIKWDGDDNKIANACRTTPFKCKYDIQTVRTVICEEG